jgi:hypothetical protein
VTSLDAILLFGSAAVRLGLLEVIGRIVCALWIAIRLAWTLHEYIVFV